MNSCKRVLNNTLYQGTMPCDVGLPRPDTAGGDYSRLTPLRFSRTAWVLFPTRCVTPRVAGLVSIIAVAILSSEREALLEAAQAAGRSTCTYLAAQHHRLASRRGKDKAAVAVGYSILVAV